MTNRAARATPDHRVRPSVAASNHSTRLASRPLASPTKPKPDQTKSDETHLLVDVQGRRQLGVVQRAEQHVDAHALRLKLYHLHARTRQKQVKKKAENKEGKRRRPNSEHDTQDKKRQRRIDTLPTQQQRTIRVIQSSYEC